MLITTFVVDDFGHWRRLDELWEYCLSQSPGLEYFISGHSWIFSAGDVFLPLERQGVGRVALRQSICPHHTPGRLLLRYGTVLAFPYNTYGEDIMLSFCLCWYQCQLNHVQKCKEWVKATCLHTFIVCKRMSKANAANISIFTFLVNLDLLNPLRLFYLHLFFLCLLKLNLKQVLMAVFLTWYMKCTDQSFCHQFLNSNFWRDSTDFWPIPISLNYVFNNIQNIFFLFCLQWLIISWLYWQESWCTQCGFESLFKVRWQCK